MLAGLALVLLAGGGIALALRAGRPAARQPAGLFGPGSVSATPFGTPQPAAGPPPGLFPPPPAVIDPAPAEPVPQFPQREQPQAEHPPQPLYAFA
jgi:hypothetical protein